MQTTTITLSTRRTIRQAAGATQANIPVQVIPGDSAPRQTGRSFFFTTPGGAPVYYPNAYRAAWGKPVYHASTRRVEVGEQWLAAN